MRGQDLTALHRNSVVPAAIGILATSFPPGPAKSRAFACFGAGAPIGNAV